MRSVHLTVKQFLLRLMVATLTFLLGTSVQALLIRSGVESISQPIRTVTYETSTKTCDVHKGVLMYWAEPEEVFPELHYSSSNYFAAMMKDFPNSNSLKVIGCGSGPREKPPKQLTCPACRVREGQWKEAALP